MDKILIRWVDAADAVPEWLWEACFAQPLEGRWWYRTLDRCGIDDQFSFAYGIITEEGNYLGIAPAFIMDVPLNLVAPPWIERLTRKLGAILPQLRYVRTLFIGSPCADEGSVGILPYRALSDIISPLQRAIDVRARQKEVSMIVWKDFPDQAAEALTPLIRTHGFFKLVSYPGTRASISGRDFEGYLQGLRSNQRYQLKRKLRRSHEMGALETIVVQNPEEHTICECYSLFCQTYEKGKTKFERLTLDFFRLIAAEPVSHFILLRSRETGATVAFMLCFLLGKRVINKFIGLQYAYSGNWFLFFRLWEEAVRWALQVGADEIQSGQTGYQAKHDTGHSLIPLFNYCRHRNPFIHALFKVISGYISWATLDGDLSLLAKKTVKGP